MRVISQNSYIDVPYEEIALSTGRNASGTEHYIFLNFLHPQRSVHENTLGTYSTEEKALKAMEMLRSKYEDYTEYMIGRNQDFQFAFIPPKVFQFPKDEEVEV